MVCIETFTIHSEVAFWQLCNKNPPKKPKEPILLRTVTLDRNIEMFMASQFNCVCLTHSRNFRVRDGHHPQCKLGP